VGEWLEHERDLAERMLYASPVSMTNLPTSTLVVVMLTKCMGMHILTPAYNMDVWVSSTFSAVS